MTKEKQKPEARQAAEARLRYLQRSEDTGHAGERRESDSPVTAGQESDWRAWALRYIIPLFWRGGRAMVGMEWNALLDIRARPLGLRATSATALRFSNRPLSLHLGRCVPLGGRADADNLRSVWRS